MKKINVVDILRTPLYGFVHTGKEPLFANIDRTHGLRISEQVINEYEAGEASITLDFGQIQQVSVPFVEGCIGKIMAYLHTHSGKAFGITTIKESWQPVIEQVMHKTMQNFVRRKK